MNEWKWQWSEWADYLPMKAQNPLESSELYPWIPAELILMEHVLSLSYIIRSKKKLKSLHICHGKHFIHTEISWALLPLPIFWRTELGKKFIIFLKFHNFLQYSLNICTPHSLSPIPPRIPKYISLPTSCHVFFKYPIDSSECCPHWRGCPHWGLGQPTNGHP